MDCGFVDLYQHFQADKPLGAVGTLRYYCPDAHIVASSPRVRPAVLIIPGGGYGHVSPREGEPVALRFAAKGYCAFVLTYSVAPLRYPVALREAAMAMAYIRQQAKEFQIGSNMVCAVGFSAGGHLCACLGTLFDRPELRDIAAADVIRPDALGLHYPVAVSWGRTHEGTFQNLCGDNESLRSFLSIDTLVRPDMPPVFLWHTREDPAVPCRNSLILAQKLEECGIDFAMHLYHKGEHGLSTADEQAYPADAVPYVSRDVPGWLDAEVHFFEEINIKIKNCEVKR